MGDKNLKEVKLKIAFAIFLTLCYRTTAASGLTQGTAGTVREDAYRGNWSIGEIY